MVARQAGSGTGAATLTACHRPILTTSKCELRGIRPTHRLSSHHHHLVPNFFLSLYLPSGHFPVQQTPTRFLMLRMYLLWTFRKNGIEHEWFLLWLLSLNIITSGFIPAVTWLALPFLLWPKMISLCGRLVPSSADGHLGGFHLLASAIRAARNICERGFA